MRPEHQNRPAIFEEIRVQTQYNIKLNSDLKNYA